MVAETGTVLAHCTFIKKYLYAVEIWVCRAELLLETGTDTVSRGLSDFDPSAAVYDVLAL
jgi:hypothetical protein